MSNMTSESDDMIMSRDCINSAGIDEVNMVGNGELKKGPWTSAEDAILVDYVNKHGEGNWNAVQKHSGLYRCGKSCRLRWANHLRPDLKKGAFTPEEERKIIELHAKMGNKWARMAVELPGRTDNEIKNFWNTRTKRRQRAGLPIYPPDISLQTLTDNTQAQNMVTFDSSNAEILPDNAFQLPAIEFKKLGLNHDLYPPNCLDLSGVNFVDAPLLPNNNNSNSFVFPMLKRVRRCPVFDYDCYPRVDVDMNQSGSHAFYNGNTCSSSGPWAQERELPSLQYSTQLGSCNAASPLPSLESFETLTQHSNFIGQTKSNRESGLLEAVLLQSQNLKTASIFPPDATTDSSSQHHGDADDDWDSMSPLGHSAASVFSEYIPHLGESPLDEHQSLEAISVKQEADEYGGKQSDKGDDEKATQINYSRPDYLLDSNYCSSNWYGLGSNPYHSNYDHSDPVRALLDEDLSIDSNKHVLDSSFYGSTSKWDDISEICRNR